jgi:CRP-like cAMP-binding protein
MKHPIPPLEVDRLKEFVPLGALSQERLSELVALGVLQRFSPGAHLFHEGDVDHQTLYLYSGEVRLRSPRGDVDHRVLAGTPEACHPLAERQPRPVSAVAQTEVTVLQFDNNVLDYMITWDQLATLEQGSASNEQIDAENLAHIGKMISPRPFQNIAPPNMRRLLKRMEKMPVQKGDVVVNQGDPGDYYYIIEQGRAKVTKKIELASLSEGASFGEEALIANAVRNASVTMETDGVLMRLSKQDFDELLKEPLLNWISAAEAREKVNRGAIWLDVRHAREFNHYRLPNAVNLPLHELRQRMKELDSSLPYVCYCETGRRSSAAAFLLSQAGFDVSLLRGGLQVLPPLLRSEESSEADGEAQAG